MTGVNMCGGMRPGETLVYRELYPTMENSYAEGITIDDHLGCQLGPVEGLPVCKDVDGYRDSEAFAASASFYKSSGLETHPKKEVRRDPVVTAWGAEIEGDVGWIGPPRHKLAGFMFLSAQLAGSGIMVVVGRRAAVAVCCGGTIAFATCALSLFVGMCNGDVV